MKKQIRAYNSQPPAHWDGYQKLAYALIYTALEALARPVRFKAVYTYEEYPIYTSDYTNHAIQYADAWHFIQSKYAEACCAACGLDIEEMREKVKARVNPALVRLGDIELSKEPKTTIGLRLGKKTRRIEYPSRWISK